VRGTIFLALDGGDTIVNVEEIVMLKAIPITRPGNRARILLRNGHYVRVPEDVETILERIRTAYEEVL
jgi:uncharacterized protein YlzI (FlbEa/FlbD family)